MKKTKDFIKKIWANWLLIVSIIIPIILLVVAYCCPSFIELIQDKFKLEFFQLFVLTGAMLTILWINKRHKQSEKQYKQTEDTIFLNKVNTIYFEAIKLLGGDEQKKQPTAKNLISAIQVSINFHYRDSSKEDKNKAKFKILNFYDMYLRGVNLRGVNLSGANLNNVDFHYVKLSHANLNGANLTNANLTNSDLRTANLASADLRGANLSGANLKNANFRSADLKNANFRNVIYLEDVDFTDAQNMPDHLKEMLE